MKPTIAFAAVTAFCATVQASQLQAFGVSPQKKQMLNTQQLAAGFDWEVTSTGVFDEDYGVTYVRFTHILKANILANDKIVFDLGFTNDPDTFAVTNLKNFDDSRCVVYQNLQSPNYWIQKSFDGYYYKNLLSTKPAGY